MQTLTTHWELGIFDKETCGTSTIKEFTTLEDAIEALNKIDDETAFIDLWHCPENNITYQIDQYMTKKMLNKLTN